MDYGYFKDLPRRAAPDKELHDTTFNIAKNPKCDQKHKGHVSKVIAKTFCLLLTQEQELILICTLRTNNQQKNYPGILIENFKKRVVYSSFKDKTWGADMQLIISKYNKAVSFLLFPCS